MAITFVLLLPGCSGTGTQQTDSSQKPAGTQTQKENTGWQASPTFQSGGGNGNADPNAAQVIGNPPPTDSVTAPAMVREFYNAVASKDYEAAWSMIHPAVHANPSGVTTKEAFIAAQKKMGNQLVKAIEQAPLDSYKFYGVQLTMANVAVVRAEFSDGQTRTIHLAKDQRNVWKLFWNPQDGIE